MWEMPNYIFPERYFLGHFLGFFIILAISIFSYALMLKEYIVPGGGDKPKNFSLVMRSIDLVWYCGSAAAVLVALLGIHSDIGQRFSSLARDVQGGLANNIVEPIEFVIQLCAIDFNDLQDSEDIEVRGAASLVSRVCDGIEQSDGSRVENGKIEVVISSCHPFMQEMKGADVMNMPEDMAEEHRSLFLARNLIELTCSNTRSWTEFTESSILDSDIGDVAFLRPQQSMDLTDYYIYIILLIGLRMTRSIIEVKDEWCAL
jgi:hypothetical protein